MEPRVAAATKIQMEVVDKQLAKGKDFFFFLVSLILVVNSLGSFCWNMGI